MRLASVLLVPALGLAPGPVAGSGLDGDARAVRHLLNRAGLGASAAEVERGLSLGPEALVEELLAAASPEAPFEVERQVDAPMRMEMRALPDDERRERMRDVRRAEREQLAAYLEAWMERLLAAHHPLQERMTLFWHGYFPSSQREVKRSDETIAQIEVLRRHALGSFRELLSAVSRDAAMLEYLDNEENRAGHPNENFARELLELFTLGEGHYTEEDVREVARAFTGWTDRDGAFVFLQRRHDDGTKRILGRKGRLGGDDVLEILLEHEASAPHLAGELLAYFEGVEPDQRRVARYARLLRRHDWQLAPVLRALFLDPEFYRDEVVGARVASPLDFLVGSARRLGIAPPPRLLLAGAALLGELPCFPPSVAGWEGGLAWATAGALLLRANLAGVLVGEVHPREVVGRAALGGVPGGVAGGLGRLRWYPAPALALRVAASGARTDADVAAFLARELLAVELDAATLAALAGAVSDEREAAGFVPGAWSRGSPRVEPLLRRLAHLVLSLPEASLH